MRWGAFREASMNLATGLVTILTATTPCMEKERKKLLLERRLNSFLILIFLEAGLIFSIQTTAASHPFPKYSTEEAYEGFTDAASAKCPDSPTGEHDWHDATGTATQHEIKICCWCGQKRFVDSRVIGKSRADEHDTQTPTTGSHGLVSTKPTDYSGVNNPKPTPGPVIISPDVIP